MTVDAEAAVRTRWPARGIALLDEGRAAEARACFRSAIRSGDTAPATWLNLALAEAGCGRHPLARRMMMRVAARTPEWEEPWIRLAELQRAQGQYAMAEHAYRQALSIKPNRIEALIALGGLLVLRGAGQEARIHLLHACGINADRAEAWDALGLALMQGDDASLALSAFIEAQRLEPSNVDYVLHGLDAADAGGVSEIERARLSMVHEGDPCNPVPLIGLGILYERCGMRAAGIDALEVASILAPDAALPITFLGGILARSARTREAEKALRRALELEDTPRIRNDLAAVLMRMHRHAEARALLLDIAPPFDSGLPVLCNLANATVCLGMQDEAIRLVHRAIAKEGQAILPRRSLCNTLPYADGVTGADLLAATRDLGQRLSRAPLPPFTKAPDPDRVLTLGLLSGTLKTHPVGWLTVAGFESLDPHAFRLTGLVQNNNPGDPITRRFHAIATDWIEVDTLDDLAIAARAREAGIDILIDLGGYGDAARMTACAHRLAPVQIKWVGMQNHSTGLAEMDWFITDRWETPPGFEPLYSERLLRLADGYVCYSPPPYAPDVVPLPALRNGYLTFGCFNNLAKITPRVIATWSAIMHRVPGSRLVLKTHQFSDVPTAERLRNAFAAHGIDGARLELQGSSPHRAFMDAYNKIDFVLDPFIPAASRHARRCGWACPRLPLRERFSPRVIPRAT